MNLSQSGVGASVGAKGARLTVSPKGTTYITVGRGGFYYRQNLSPGSSSATSTPKYQSLQVEPPLEEIKTADVQELLESSKSELVESLNKRAQMFNPATILFVVFAICAAIGFVYLTGAASPTQPTLPALDGPRQANRTDEYAVLLAHYGQPSTLAIAQAGSVPLRTATYENAHLAIVFVPSGCVDAYAYYEAHKNDIAPSKVLRRQHGLTHTADSAAPLCEPPADKASTIVGYVDAASGSPIDSGTAERYLASINARSQTQPILKTADTTHASRHDLKAIPEPPSIGYNEETLRGEQQRLADKDASSRKNAKIGWGLLIGALLFLVPGVSVHRKNKEQRTTRLVYDLSAAASGQQHILEKTLEHLLSSKMMWRVDSQSAISDWKRNAGASHNLKREQVSIRRTVPPRVESNVVPFCLDLDKLKMFFLPDQILYWQHGTFASIEYADLAFQAASTRFIEEQVQTSDSQQVGSTWRYVRKDGGPDQRFNNNRQLPVMLYGLITAVSSGGLNLILHTSSVAAASSFASSFRSFQSGRDRHLFNEVEQSGGKEREKNDAFFPENVRKAMELLGLNHDMTPEQVTVAYRHMAQMYHPDKVAGLAPEFQKLAEERMREINAAHQIVRRYQEGA